VPDDDLQYVVHWLALPMARATSALSYADTTVRPGRFGSECPTAGNAFYDFARSPTYGSPLPEPTE
jgi:hypothetical protein